MKFTETEEIRNQLQRDGSLLKGIRGLNGIEKGLIAGGITLLVFGVLLTAPCFLFSLRAVLATAILFLLPSVFLIVLGVVLRKRKIENYMDYYVKKSGYSREELEQVDKELMSPDVIVIGNQMPDKGKKAPNYYCFFTKKHFVMPDYLGGCWIVRIEEIIGAVYSERIPGYNGYKFGLVLLFTQGTDDSPIYNANLNKQSCLEVIEIITRQNPLVITDQIFQYNGRRYDMFQNPKEVVDLQLEHMNKKA